MSFFLFPTAFQFVYVEFCLPSSVLAVLPTFSCTDLIRFFIPLSKLLVKALNEAEVVQLSMKYPPQCIFFFWKGTADNYPLGIVSDDFCRHPMVVWSNLCFCSLLTSLSYWVMSKAFTETELWHWFLLPCSQGLLWKESRLVWYDLFPTIHLL